MTDGRHYAKTRQTAKRTDPRLDPNNNPACDGVDPDIFFPDTGRTDVAELAKAICHRCPIEAGCLEWAIDSPNSAGILGGKTLKERKAIKKAAAEAAEAAAKRRLLGDLLAERSGDPDALLKEFVHPPMPIAAWAE